MELFIKGFMAVCAAILAGGFTLVGGLLVGAGLSTLRDTLAARKWPQVFAVIQSSTVDGVTRQETRMFRPLVTYAFSTANGNFTASRIGFAERRYGREAAARKVADRYPAGATVMARCNPDDPAESILEIRWLDSLAILLFGLLCWTLPIGAAIAIGIPWPISVGILTVLLLIPALLVTRQRNNLQRARREGVYPPPGSGNDEQVAELVARGEKLLAIRLYRELHGGGLKKAREAVEAMHTTTVIPDP